MIIAAMLTYYVLAIGLLVLVAVLSVRQAARQRSAQVDAIIARMNETFGHTPALEPFVREPLPEPEPGTQHALS